MTRTEAAERLAERMLESLSSADIPGLNFLLVNCRSGTPDELEELRDRLKSAILSELESYTTPTPPKG